MKKKKAKIVCLILAALLLLLAGFIYVQRENMKAVVEGAQSATGDLEQRLKENEQKLEDALSELSKHDLTEEEKSTIRRGTLSQDELEHLLTGEEASEEENAYAKSLAELLSRVYALRQQYVTLLEAMEAEAKEEYSALPQSDRTTAKLVKIAKGYISRAAVLEKECDDTMDAIVAEMTKLVQDNKGDLSIVDSVIDAYANEKRLKKAWYISKMKERGLV